MLVDAMTTIGQNAGRVADVKCANLQMHYLSSAQRAFSLANSSRVRQSYLAAGRRLAHGDDKGIFINGVLAHIQDSLASGYDGSDSGSD